MLPLLCVEISHGTHLGRKLIRAGPDAALEGIHDFIPLASKRVLPPSMWLGTHQPSKMCYNRGLMLVMPDGFTPLVYFIKHYAITTLLGLAARSLPRRMQTHRGCQLDVIVVVVYM